MLALSRDLQIYSSGARRKPTLRYEPNLAKTSRQLADTFELAHCDGETRQFLEQARDFSIWKLFVADVLRCFVSRTTANGLLGRGSMFVVSTELACALLRPAGAPRGEHGRLRLPPLAKGGRATPYTSAPTAVHVDPASTHTAATASASADVSAGEAPYTPPFRSLLDIGAGDGGVTAKVAPLFEKVYATEYSMTMRWRLRQRGYTVLDVDDPFHDSATGERRVFDVITCFNVLDRADTPLTLLRSMRDSLKPEGGLLLLAVVLPWCPFVEYNNQQRRPRELLPMRGGHCCKGACFEESLTKLVENVLEPVGFELVRWTKLPYLCEGNLKLEYALLHDAVMILKRKPAGEFTDTATLAPVSDYA